MSGTNTNLESYSSPAALKQYTSATTLAACETYLFEKYVERGQAVLDIGVGAGRTTTYLASQASPYVGLDYSQALVDACRRRFPSLTFVCEDATDLRRFASNSFHTVVFSHNGIDSIQKDTDRTRCIREVARVLRPGGCFIFSSHNVRSIGFRANYRKYLADLVSAQNGIVSQTRSLAHEWGVTQLIRKFLRSIRISVHVALRSPFMPKLYKGTGYFFDYSHGGLILFASTPEYVRAEAESAGLEVQEMIGNTYPVYAEDHWVQWYYYVLRK